MCPYFYGTPGIYYGKCILEEKDGAITPLNIYSGNVKLETLCACQYKDKKHRMDLCSLRDRCRTQREEEQEVSRLENRGF